jgi:hypothetical protein
MTWREYFGASSSDYRISPVLVLVLLNKKSFESFELFDKKVRNYSLFDKFLNPYLNPSLVCVLTHFWLTFVPKWGIFKLLGDYQYLCYPSTLVALSIGKVGDVIPKGQAYAMEISQSDRTSSTKRKIRWVVVYYFLSSSLQLPE